MRAPRSNFDAERGIDEIFDAEAYRHGLDKAKPDAKIVYNEERDTLGRRFPSMMNRAIIVKVNRLFRF